MSKPLIFVAASAAASLCAIAADGQPPASSTTAQVMVQVIERVCRPAADTQSSPDNFAPGAGLQAEPHAPANLPMGIAGLSTWSTPTPDGKLYVMSGVFPESTTPSTCVVALYDTPGGVISKAMENYVFGLKRGFILNPRYNFTANGYHLSRYDRRVGDTLHSVMVMDAAAPQPGQPSAVVAAFVVDEGWMLHPAKARP